ncbi:BQ5605_C004g03128 [Microbotryum silenes-dioicae]|uniref:BQ5605_C004g03128 protein n=1 Tax=Microbotryum silenes-dioicae TaxID=796604 RepID=A0A2X0MEE4_9BASI|nr:BQ5605_C004g03128 [Microbotryum silenes-dioicae]
MSSTTSTQKKDLGQREPDIIDQSPSVTHSNQISMTPESCSDDVDSNADSDPAVDDSEASSSDGGEEAMDRLRQVVDLLENCAPNHLQLEYDTMQAKRQAIMSSNLLWSAEEKANYGQWPLILGDRRKADEWTLKDTIPILKLPLYMATEEAKLTKFFLTDPPPILHWRNQPEQEHEWTACKYERCIAVIETSHGAPSLSFHQHPADHLTLCPVIGVDDPNIPSREQNFANCSKNIVALLTARAEGPIPRVTGGSDRPTIPYAEWERVIFMRQPDGNACGVFVCQTMETLVAAVAFQSELDWSWSPLKPLQDNFYADQRAYMLDVVKTCLLAGTGAPPPVPESVPLALKESSPELEEKPLGSPGIEISLPTLILIDPSIGTMYTSDSNPDAQCTAPLISRSPQPNPAPSIATIGSMPDAPPMRLQRAVKFDPNNSLPVSKALEVVACLPRYQTRTLAVRSIAPISTNAPSPRRSKRQREASFFKAARLTQCRARNTNLMLESIAQGMGSPKLHRTLPCHPNTHIGRDLF